MASNVTIDRIRAILLRDNNSHAHYDVLCDNCRHCSCETYIIYGSYLIYSWARGARCVCETQCNIVTRWRRPSTACNLIPRRRSSDAARTLSNASAEIFTRANSCSFAMMRACKRNAVRSFFKICSGLYGDRLMADDRHFFFFRIFARIARSRLLVRLTAV